MELTMTQISPTYTSETFGVDPTLDEKILIFEDRELGWRFRIAQETEKVTDSGYGLISILFAYFEMFAQYHSGICSENGSKKAFRDGVRLIYPASTLTDDNLDAIYVRVRCGMYHNGYTKFGTLIDGDYPEALDVKNGNVQINPHWLLRDLQNHFTCYLTGLKDPKNVTPRSNFERFFDAGTQ
jgi:hypothetical protein